MARNKPRKVRGPSRPVDPRYAPGPAANRNRDRFGVVLITFSIAFVLVIILFASILAGNSSTTGTTASSGTSSGAPGQTTRSVDLNAQATAQAVAVGTQMVVDATETAPLPRIEPKDAIALQAANNVTIVDVRGTNDYLQAHIKGAKSIPESEVSKQMADFPRMGNLVVYCQ